MPTSSRILRMSAWWLVTHSSSTQISPDVRVSRRFTERSRVLLPDPEGPTMRMTSPRATSRSTPRRACTWPKLFLACLILMIGSAMGPQPLFHEAHQT